MLQHILDLANWTSPEMRFVPFIHFLILFIYLFILLRNLNVVSTKKKNYEGKLLGLSVANDVIFASMR